MVQYECLEKLTVRHAVVMSKSENMERLMLSVSIEMSIYYSRIEGAIAISTSRYTNRKDNTKS